MSTKFGKFRALGAAALVATGIVVVGAGSTPAHAVVIDQTCKAFSWANDAYNPNGAPLQSGISLPLTLKTLSGPPEIPSGLNFTVTSAEGDGTPLPTVTHSDTLNLDLPVLEVKNIETQIQVTGAGSILGAVSVSGGNAIGSSLTKSGNVLTLTLPGSKTSPASVAPAGGPDGAAYYPGGGTVITPQISANITAGAAGTTIKSQLIRQDIDVVLGIPPTNAPLGVHLVCDPAANTLGSVEVVAPPPPGAPDALPDTVKTDKNTAVTIDVQKNDVPDDEFPIDPDSVAVTKAAKNGTTKVNDDGTITYTPKSGFVGVDSFQYHLCSDITVDQNPQIDRGEVAAVAAPCDITTVKVTVGNESAEDAKTTGTTVAPTTTPPTTVAAAAELPRTGKSSAPLALGGAASVVLGFALASAARSRKNATQ